MVTNILLAILVAVELWRGYNNYVDSRAVRRWNDRLAQQELITRAEFEARLGNGSKEGE